MGLQAGSVSSELILICPGGLQPDSRLGRVLAQAFGWERIPISDGKSVLLTADPAFRSITGNPLPSDTDPAERFMTGNPLPSNTNPAERFMTGNPLPSNMAPAERSAASPSAGILISSADELKPMRSRRLLFVISLDEAGLNLEYTRMLGRFRRDPHFLEGCIGGAVVDGPSELYTKSLGKELVMAANLAGCLFPGRPLVEGTGSLYNYHILAELQHTDWTGAYVNAVRELAERIKDFSAPAYARPSLLVMHASIRETSNTFLLWNMVKEELGDCMDIQEISLQNGTVYDCVGCPFTTCMHFSKQGRCYYGGVVVEQVYPAMEECSGLLVLCPNYNDALSANISASVNRLTALYRRRTFFDKYLYGIVVSGYSGSDIVAAQLISGLNMNKTLILPPHFAMMETANDPQSIRKVEGIEERARFFAREMRRQMTGCP